MIRFRCGKKSRAQPAKENRKRITRWVRLMVPEVERAHAHCKLHSIDVIECRRMCEKVKREPGQKEQNSFSHGFFAPMNKTPTAGSVKPELRLTGPLSGPGCG